MAVDVAGLFIVSYGVTTGCTVFPVKTVVPGVA
jgi:hypothetical protein